MALLRTLALTPSFEYSRESLTHTTEVEFDGSNFIQRYGRRQRPVYKFTCQLYPLKREETETLITFHAFHQGGKSFLFDGGPYATVRNYSLFGEGDGSKRQFFLPNRYVTATSFSFQTQNQVTLATSNWVASSTNGWPSSLNADPGVLTFANSTNTIPLSGHDLRAIYACRYRCFFEPDGFKISEFAAGLFKAEIVIREAEIF